MEYTTLIISFLAGTATSFILAKSYFKKQKNEDQSTSDNSELEKQLIQLNTIKDQLEQALLEKQDELKKLNVQNTELNKQLASVLNDNKHLANQKEELQNVHQFFKEEFESIAHKVIRQNSKEINEHHQKQLGNVLLPFKESIHNFEKKMEEVYDKELRDKLSLKEEVKKLYQLNQELGNEAKSLTRALRGDTKKQGDWGELILEKILESSGLEKDREYSTQYSSVNSDSDRIQPDIIIHLPDNKHLVIDSKVSLIAYNNYIDAITEEEKKAAISAHLLSFKTHIRTLSEKNYHTAQSLHSPDFVLLFTPIESAFSLAMKEDQNLFNYAWEKKIVIVSPTTLLATLRTVASVWKQEKQTRNVIEIARLSGNLYDKFVGFIDEMEKIEKGIDSSKKAYLNAMKKLQLGNGNMIKTADKIRSLGAKTNKSIPDKYINKDTDVLD